MGTLRESGECLFKISKNGARLKPTSFGSISCIYFEWKYHSFVGQMACKRLTIDKNRHLLWGHNLWWICDCASVKEFLEYKVSISMVFRWSQELLDCHFSILYRCSKMMADFDTLTIIFSALISQHCMIA